MAEHYTTYKKLSLIVPCYNEERSIKKCIESIANNGYPHSHLELFVVDGGSTDRTVDILTELKHRYTILVILNNPNMTVPYALNLAIKKATGEYIVRLDAHALYPKKYLENLLVASLSLNADNIGAPIVTKVSSETIIGKSIQFVLADKLGVGNSTFRISGGESDGFKEVDTVPFGFFKRDVFDRFGLFDTRLSRNQDIEFNKRMKRGGARVFLTYSTHSIYFARESLFPFARQSFKTGMWIIQTSIITRRTDSVGLRHFAPLLFTLSVLLSFALLVISPKNNSLLLIVILSFYITVLLARSFMVSTSRSTLADLLCYTTLHLSYGIGSLYAVIKAPYLLISHNKSVS